MAYIPDTKSYRPCTTNDIAKRRGIYTSEVQDYLVEFTTRHPDADIQILSMSDDPKAIEAGTDVLFNTTQGTFILYPDGEFELVENGKNVRRNQTTKRNKIQNVYTKAVVDGLLSIDIPTQYITTTRRTDYNLVRINAYVLSIYSKKNNLKTYGKDSQIATQELENLIKQVIAAVERTYNIQIESGWYEDLRDAGKHRNERRTNGSDYDYMIFVPLAGQLHE